METQAARGTPEEPARPPQGDEAWEASGLRARGGCCAAWRR